MKALLCSVGFAVALCTAAPVGAQTLATWEQTVNVSAAEGALTKISGCDLCPDAGGYSTTRVDVTGGYADFVPASGQRLSVGLTAEAVPAVNGMLVDYAFSIWPNGAFEIRERGVYRGEGSFASGDRFRVSIEYGKVVYRRNGVKVYTSKTLPLVPMALSVTLSSRGSSLTGAALYLGSDFVTDPPPPPPPPPAPIETAEILPLGIVSSGPYQAIIERLPHPKPELPALGPAGSWINDPVFQSRILRATDNVTRPGAPDRSYRSPSSPHQNAWSAQGSYFYVVSGDGSVLPFRFDARKGTATRVQPTTTGNGGLVLGFYIEPQFSYVSDTQIYGSRTSALRAIDEYDFATGAYRRLLDLDTVVPGMQGTYMGGIASSGGPTERIMAFFGGTSQDRHHYVVVFDKADPTRRLLLDTTASTVDGVPTPLSLNFSLHHAALDRSGRYVMLYPPYADQQSARKAAQSYVWDTETGSFAELGISARPYGHDAFGYGVSVNQDCCRTTTWDAAQWQFRNLSTPLITTDVIKKVLSPKEVYLGEHGTWNNARPDTLVPFVSALFRSPLSTTEWRAWDDEIVAVQTNAGAANPTTWRFAHHRSDFRSDIDPMGGSFWYQPRPNISSDGRWVMFTSNWEKTLGTDPTGDSATRARQDVFIVELKSSVPPPPNVELAATPLPSGRATVAYAASLQAAGGRGTFVFSVSAGSLPAGLSLDNATGAITGTVAAPETATFTIYVFDPTEPLNDASGTFTITIAPPPVAMALPAFATARLTVPYAAAPQASGGNGVYEWSVVDGVLPAGLTLDAATGAIAGTATSIGAYTFTIRAASVDEPANAADASGSIVVGPSPIVMTTTAVAAGRERVSYRTTLAASGGTGVTTWSATLPAGLTLNSNTGAIAGTPTLAGTYDVSITATDAGDPTNTATNVVVFTITPGVKVSSPRLMPAATVGVPYAYTFEASNVQGKAKWNLQGGALPPGMSFNATGSISGTCMVPGTYYFNARVKDSNTDDTLTMTLVVR